MRESRKFCQGGGGIQLFFFTFFLNFFPWWGKERIQIPLKRAISAPPAKRQLHGVMLAGRWWPNIEWLLGSFVIFQGIRTIIAKKPYLLVIFQRGGWSRPPVPDSGFTHAHFVENPKDKVYRVTRWWVCFLWSFDKSFGLMWTVI